MSHENIEAVLRFYLLPIHDDEGGHFERPQLEQKFREASWRKTRKSAATTIRSVLSPSADSGTVDRSAYIARYFYLPETIPSFLKLLNHQEGNEQSWLKSAHAIFLIGDLGSSDQRKALTEYVSSAKLQGEWSDAFELWAQAIASLASEKSFSNFEKNLDQELDRLKKNERRSEEDMRIYEKLSAVKRNLLPLAKAEAKLRSEILALASIQEQSKVFVENYLRSSGPLQIWAALQLRRLLADARNPEIYEALNNQLRTLKKEQGGSREFVLACRALLALNGKLSSEYKTHLSKVESAQYGSFLDNEDD